MVVQYFDRNGNPETRGYVEYETVNQARTAFDKLNGRDVNGQELQLTFAKPLTQIYKNWVHYRTLIGS